MGNNRKDFWISQQTSLEGDTLFFEKTNHQFTLNHQKCEPRFNETFLYLIILHMTISFTRYHPKHITTILVINKQHSSAYIGQSTTTTPHNTPTIITLPPSV